MTQSAKKTLFALVLGNIFIVIIAIIMYQYLMISSLRFSHHPGRVLASLNRLIHQLQIEPKTRWPRILARQSRPWMQLTVTSSPKFKVMSFKQVVRSKPKYSIQVSIALEPTIWLNIDYASPIFKNKLLLLMYALLTLIWLLALILLSYWAIKRVNNPVKQLIENLDYAKKQNQWQSIPVVGNEEQRLIFSHVNELQQQANKSITDKTHMLAAISHDLRTPLTRLKLRVDNLEKPDLSEKLIQDIDEMELMITQTLDYFRDSNNEELGQQFDLITMLVALSEDAQDLNFDVRFSTKEKKIIFFGKINLLKRAFSNLINNAIQYAGSANISLWKEGDEIHIVIDDEGEGLSQEQLSQAFNHFYRGEGSRSRQSGGAGLGLTIAKEIIQAHNGMLRLSNRVEGGLRAHITLIEQNAH